MRVASTRRRLSAFLFWQCVLWSLVALTLQGVELFRSWVERLRGRSVEDGSKSLDSQDAGWEQRPWSLQSRVALRGSAMAMAVGYRQRPAGSRRAFRLRRVDARTGGKITMRSAALGELFDQASHAIGDSLFRDRARQDREHLQAFSPQIEALRDEHAEDPVKLMEAMRQFHAAFDLHPFRALGWQFGGRVLVSAILLFGFRDGRTVRDRVTGTVMVVDP